MKKILSIFTLAVVLVMIASFSVFAAADTERPSAVTGLKAVAQNGAVKLTWDKASDNVGIKGYDVHYGLSPVTQSGEEYDNVKDVGDVLEYLATGLDNGKKYYFSVIAFDAADNESAKWAKEQSATPSEDAGGGSDTEAPIVKAAEVLNKIEVKVEFSEEIVLPEEDPEDAFAIENTDSFEPLTISAVEYAKDEEDKEKEDKTKVILTTEPQTEGITYKITVGVDIKDNAENPMISGTSDTAIFTGSGAEKANEDKDGPELLSAVSQNNTHIVVNFNEKVVLGTDPTKNFDIFEADDNTQALNITGVELNKNTAGVADAAAIITTTPQLNKKYVVVVIELKDEAGNVIPAKKSSASFDGMAATAVTQDSSTTADSSTTVDSTTDSTPLPDTTAPKDVSMFLAKAIMEAQKYNVELTWLNPEENADDSKQQILYLSEDQGKQFGTKATVEPSLAKYLLSGLVPGEYWFKLTQKDEAGNESEGTVTKIILSETGPGLLGLTLVSLGLGRFVTRRKKK